ncbi:hypothetical protein NDU88_002276 [Pleurodeles waltl]|uniref:Uncharacterized protein n=1 Tax=Pleurodeles waltl TaxID=8319 RepID=A0AAV7TK24_PLEWA|nr:hypothetical protein NDU88_002276 [Pleurodeles waltl]
MDLVGPSCTPARLLTPVGSKLLPWDKYKNRPPRSRGPVCLRCSGRDGQMQSTPPLSYRLRAESRGMFQFRAAAFLRATRLHRRSKYARGTGPHSRVNLWGPAASRSLDPSRSQQVRPQQAHIHPSQSPRRPAGFGSSVGLSPRARPRPQQQAREFSRQLGHTPHYFQRSRTSSSHCSLHLTLHRGVRRLTASPLGPQPQGAGRVPLPASVSHGSRVAHGLGPFRFSSLRDP